MEEATDRAAAEIFGDLAVIRACFPYPSYNDADFNFALTDLRQNMKYIRLILQYLFSRLVWMRTSRSRRRLRMSQARNLLENTGALEQLDRSMRFAAFLNDFGLYACNTFDILGI